MAAVTRRPAGLRSGGRALWDALTADGALDVVQQAVALEACRAKDRLDQLNDVIDGKGVLQLMHFRSMVDFDDEDTRHIKLTVDGAMAEARQLQQGLKQMLAALRPLSDVGQNRGGARGAYHKGVGGAAQGGARQSKGAPAPAPEVAGRDAVVTPIERARRAASGSPAE